MSALTPSDFRHAWAIVGPLVDKNTGKGEWMELPANKKFYRLFSTCFEIGIWNLVYTPSRWHDTWGLSFITIRSMPLDSFLDFFLNVLRYLLQIWLIYSVGCTTYWVYVSPEWGSCDLIHVLSQSQLTNKAFTDAGIGAYSAVSDCSCSCNVAHSQAGGQTDLCAARRRQS